MILLAEGFDNDFNKVPNGLIQPLIVEDTHVQCLVPVMQGDEPNTGAVLCVANLVTRSISNSEHRGFIWRTA